MSVVEGNKYVLLRDLIQTQSYSGDENGIVGLLSSHMLDSGINFFLQTTELKDVNVGPNILVHLEGKDRGRALLFNSHIDTVPAGDMGRWYPYEPFGESSGEIDDGKMYGLGASDMKSGVFAQVEVIKALQGEIPPCDVWMLFTPNEETDGSGTRSFVDWFINNKFNYSSLGLVIPEPTQPLGYCVGQRGNYAIKVIAEREQRHAAIGSINSINDLFGFAQDLMSYKPDEDRSFGSLKITLTAVNAGDFQFPNQIPQTAELAIDIRTTPFSHEEIPEILERLAKLHHVRVENCWPPAPIVLADRETKLATIAQKGLNLKESIFPAATDLGWFTQSGLTQEAIIYGPGEIKVAHSPREYVVLDNIEQTTKNYLKIIQLLGGN